MQRLKCDVLVIGGGLAGAWAALRARQGAEKVVLAELRKTGRCGMSAFSGANILAPLGGDDLSRWRKEVVERGEYMPDQDWVDAVLSDQEARLKDMASMGVQFERDERGDLVRSVGLAHQVTRLVTVNSLQMMECLRRNLQARGVLLRDRTMITSLLTSDGCHPTKGRVTGAVGFDSRTGEPVVIEARATVMATGGTGHLDLSGDGLCQAYLAGAELTGMEFGKCFDRMAFGKKCVEVHLNSFQRMGMTLRNGNGDRFMERYSPQLKERSSRQTLGLSIVIERLLGRGPTCMDLTHLDSFDMDKLHALPAVTRRLRALKREGMEFARQKVEINITSGFLYFLGGGIRHNLYCEATIPGLYAAGEAGGFPAHGTYSVGGMNLALCCVSGYRAGENAARFAREVDHRTDEDQVSRQAADTRRPLAAKSGKRPDDAWFGLHQVLSPAQVSVFRTRDGIKSLLARIRELKQEKTRAVDAHDLIKAHKVKNYFLSAELLFTASLEREETRGCNIRADFPYRDDVNWLQRVVLCRNGNRIDVRRQPIPIYRYPVQPEKYEKTPFPFPIPNEEN